MVYLRKKKVKGVDYLYLVKSKWDKEKSSSKEGISVSKEVGADAGAKNIAKNIEA